MLVYVGFFIFTFVGGVFSGHKPPPCDSGPLCPDNEHYTRDNSTCIRTCANKWVPISDDCKPFTGCVCDGYLVRLNDDASGPCVPEQKCPCRDDPKNPNNPKHHQVISTAHAEAEAFATATQEDTFSDGKSLRHSSVKASALAKSSSTHTSVASSDCGDKKCSDPNAVYKDCPNPCPLTCAKPNPRPCPHKCNKGGCECVSGYVLNEATGRCIRPKDCPRKKCSDPNAVYKSCPNPCPLSCDHPFPKKICNKVCVEFGCECAPGFILDVNDMHGKCVRPENCPVPICCPKHSHYVINDTECPKTCGNRCLPTRDVAGACVPFTGCACNPGFVRKYDNATGPCIPERECPPIPKHCGIHEIPTSCRTVCPPQTCDSIFSKYHCLPTDCKPGCDCFDGYLRNKHGLCIPFKDCFNIEPIECGPNEVPSDCAIVCPPQSCESLYTTYMCAEKNCTAGCNCINGYLRNSRGVCVPSDECFNDPLGCDGDVNATRVQGCSDACPPTCEKPNPKLCTTICILNGCECKPGYIRSYDGGHCIDPKDCPGGAPCCGANQTYVGCKIGCPTNYCPVDDSRAQVACSMPYPCRGGCACKAGHLMVSREDPRCVLASDCPKVKCTRQNEVWNRNPSSCFLERCEDRGSVCNYPFPYPAPRCVCKKGFYRNESDICIPASECPPIGCKGDLNATLKQCPSPCPKTCDDPNAGSEGCIEICLPDDCECNPGFVLTKKKGGVCIKLEDCPGCGGDPNAMYKSCPSACEPTCTHPKPRVCTKQCMPSGCVCKPGFVKNEKNGRCIKPENCPVGCKGDCNATYKECTSMCPLTCAEPNPRPCIAKCGPSGCECNPGYVRNKDGKCIKPKDCPGCGGDPNAVYKSCPSACEPTCTHPNPRVCTKQCMPSGCVCKSGFVKNEKNGRCIKPENCPEVGCKGDCNATYKECTSMCPLTCAEPNPRPCIDKCGPSGCECNPGYVRNKDGKCIKPKDCPGCGGDPNAVYKSCPSACEPTCTHPNPRVCTKQCLPSGCVCKPGFVKNEKNGRCIKPENCPVVDKGCNGDLNATHSDCPTSCPVTCANRHSKEKILCPAVCDPSGCVCKKGYILTKKGGKCVKAEDCPVPGCGGDPNAVYKECPSACEPTCANPDPKICTLQCMPSGCVCKPGFVRNEKDGKCIKPEKCPVDCGCKGDRNATYSNCPSPCPPTCADRHRKGESVACPAVCDPPGCVCKPGFILTIKGGICIEPKDCPEPGCKGDPNAVYSDCPSACQATCEKPNSNQPCTTQCLPRGCVCKPGFIRIKKGGKCIKPKSCPVPGCGGDPNAVYKECPSACEPTCANPDPKICTLQCMPSGCVCKPGFVRNEKDGKCVKPERCPAKPKCGYNEVAVPCRQICPPQNCEIAYTEYACTEESKICEPGCDCLPDHLRNGSGICIPNEECPYPSTPVCGINEIARDCRQICPPQTCMSKYALFLCIEDLPCEPGCDCVSNYLRDDRGICIPSEQCPAPCQIPDECKRTCAKPNPPNCEYNPPKVNINGCDCKDGYILSELGGDCIPIDQCPPDIACDGDHHARPKRCPKPCPSTCKSPNQLPCKRMCEPIGCQCKPGYILFDDTGRCILPDKCPGGNPCGKNAHFVNCKTNCQGDYCPVDDKRDLVFCHPPPASDCLSGCICNLNHKRKSRADPRCILSSDCPRVNCTRPHEKWCPCPSACLAENCEDVNNQPTVCNTLVLNCDPRCICKKDHFRDSRGICIPAEDCPQKGCNGDKNAKFSNCPSKCPATCCDPDPICTKDCAKPGCVCKEGHILSEPGGICILPCDCPAEKGCKGDMNATLSDCPSKCPATCCDPDPKCSKHFDKPGCVCKEGHILSEPGGVCILPCDCPAEKGCKGDMNATLSDCPSKCPATCCDPDPKCSKHFDKPGCVCKEGHILSEPGGVCILPCDCPAEKGCKGDMNATLSDCPSKCPATCCDPDPKCSKHFDKPGCVCKEGHILSEPGGVCILPCDCPAEKGCKGDMNATLSDCPSKCPATCCDPDPKCSKHFYKPGCVCKEGHILSEPGGVCILPCDCPAEKGCNGDMNATLSDCPSKCPATCCNPDPKCSKHFDKPGCVCKEGHILSEPGGVCILPCDCPAEKGCKGDMNATLSDCPSKCPATCCDPDPKCSKHFDKPGCVCKEGHILSEPGGVCILPCDCPAEKGCKGDMNATLSDCPSKCPATCCDPDPKCSKHFDKPGCVCKEGHILSEPGGVCILPCDCPAEKGCKGDMNATLSDCPSKCPATCCDPDPKCSKHFDKPGCVCKEGHILSEPGGVCILPCDCPAEKGCKGDMNATLSDCPSKCPATCCDPDPKCSKHFDKPGCVCKEGHILSEPGGVCILPCDCPAEKGCNGDMNATLSDCPSKCPATCCDPDPKCSKHFDKPGCVCKEGHILSEPGGVCILPCDCPAEKGCKGDMNATLSDCPSKCPATCCDPDPKCSKHFNKPGCVCKEGYMLSDPDGLCILPRDCPGGSPNCCDNMTFVNCKFDCPMKRCPEDENEIFVICDPVWPCPSGCECKPGYLVTVDKKCILAADCPRRECTRPNEVWDPKPSICNYERCDQMYYTCDDPNPGRPKCVCKEDFYKNDVGVCIPAEECPKPKCGYNEVVVPCRQICPPQNCEIAYTDYACTEESNICEPGCDCLPDHLRNGSGICIPNEQCPYPSTPVCGINEITRDCRRICPPQTCLSKYALFRCIEDIPCEPGCDCVANYLRDDRGICILSEQCPAPCQIPDECKRTCAEPNPPNCEYNPPKVNMNGCDCKDGFLLSELGGDCIPIDECPPCQIPDECKRTCAEPNPPNCAYNPPKVNINGCDCKDGFLLSELGGDCIPIDQCPPDIACNGDPNARPKRCPKPCPSTCKSPNQLPCKRMCEPIACVCKPGFLLFNDTGRCILPDKCPGGGPCGKKARFADCKTDCPGDYCPVDDNQDLVFCDPPAGECLSGCVCNFNHRRKSRKDPRCIVSSDCPPVNCTRPNEKFSTCPSACLAENCDDVHNQPTVCNTLLLNCDPRCICKKGHFRNSSGICIPAKDCPIGCNGDPNAVYSKCPSACEPTCTCPNPKICTTECKPPGCVCKQGLVLNEEDGKCIEPEDCPGCGGDPNAVYKECPSACEPTCANPNPQVCTDECKPSGCVCKKGFVLNEEDGKCIDPDSCPDS